MTQNWKSILIIGLRQSLLYLHTLWHTLWNSFFFGNYGTYIGKETLSVYSSNDAICQAAATVCCAYSNTFMIYYTIDQKTFIVQLGPWTILYLRYVRIYNRGSLVSTVFETVLTGGDPLYFIHIGNGAWILNKFFSRWM